MNYDTKGFVSLTDTLIMNTKEHIAHSALTATARMRLTPAQQRALEDAALERLEMLKRLGA